MTVPVTALHIRRLLDQVVQNLVQLQRDVHANAATWRKVAADQAAPIETLAGWLSDAVGEYYKRLGWMDTLKTDAATWQQAVALWTTQGGQASDFDALTAPLRDALDAFTGAQGQTYADLIAACDQLTAAVGMPPSLWPE